MKSEILAKLESLSNSKNVEGQQRFGIRPKTKQLGISIPELRKLGKEIGKNHELALELWKSGIHDARMLACFIAEPAKVTEQLFESWAKDFDSWDICDQCCSSLLDKTSFAWAKAVEYSEKQEEFVKRTGFVLMACLAVHDKKAQDSEFLKFLPIIKREATDERNFVRKAVNWALRQIGKRSKMLNKEAIKAGEEIQKQDSKSAKWIANDALRELKSEPVQIRLNLKYS